MNMLERTAMLAPHTLRHWVVLLAVVGLIVPCATAVADEIHVIDLDTGAKSRIRVNKITSETWSVVKYKERPKQTREKSVPSLTVVDVVRSERSPDVQTLENGMADLARGNYRDAATAFQNVCGGGYRDDAATGERTFTSFTAADPENKRKRPAWTSEYAHYHYLKALLERAKVDKSDELYNEVLMGLEDRPLDPIKVDGKTIKRSTGGFLERFKGGNSRYYPHAMLAYAEALVGLARYDEAQKAYDELTAAATSVPLRPRWHYEGLIGKGVIAQAKGDARAAEVAYEGAGAVMLSRLGKEAKVVLMEEYGELYSLGRTRVAGARLKDSEKRNAPSGFVKLRDYLQAGSPDALRRKHGSKLNRQALKALISGARHPSVQAVALNGTGLAYMAEKNYDQALMAFKSVAVKFYGDPDQTSRAYFYLAKAASEAAKKAKNAETKTMYENMKEEARRVLRTQFRDTRWAKR